MVAALILEKLKYQSHREIKMLFNIRLILIT